MRLFDGGMTYLGITRILDELGHENDDIVVINHWKLTGIGHRNEAERELAAAIAGRQQRHLHEER